MLELTELSDCAPSKLVNGNAVNSLDYRHSQSSVIKQIPEPNIRNNKLRKRMATIGIREINFIIIFFLRYVLSY